MFSDSFSSLFPVVMIALSLAAGVIYLFEGNMPKFFYWISAAGITTSTLYM